MQRQRETSCLLLRRSSSGSCTLLEAVGSAELLAEAFDAACGIDELLLAREERVAAGADVDADACDGAAGREGVATGAVDVAGLVLRMDLGLHGSNSSD